MSEAAERDEAADRDEAPEPAPEPASAPAPAPSALGTGATWQRLAILAAIALAVRVIVYVMIDYHVRADAEDYDRMGLALVERHVVTLAIAPPFEPTMFRPPGYPMFIGAIYAVFGHSYGAVKIAQGLLSALAALGLARVAERGRPGVGPWVLAAWALCPFDAVYSIALLSESLCATLLAASLCAFTYFQGWRRFAITGVLLGLTTLVRDIHLPFIPFLAAAWLVLGDGGLRGWRPRLPQAVVLGLCAALTIAPWTARNYAVSGKVVPVSSGRLGFSLWSGAAITSGAQIHDFPDGHREFDADIFVSDEERAQVGTAMNLPPKEEDALYKRWFQERVRTQPGKVLGRWLVRAPKLWLGTRFDLFELKSSLLPYGSKQWKLVKVGLFGMNTLYMVAGFAGAALAVRRRWALRWFVVPIAFTALVYLPLNSFENRYSMPVFPLLVALAAQAAHVGWTWWRARRRA